MAEALAALGVASNIVQLIGFTSSLISTGSELYKSSDGELVEHTELEAIANHLQTLNRQIIWEPKLDAQRRRQSLTKSERQLKELCESCNEVAGELLTGIRELRSGGDNKIWRSFQQALTSVWNRDKIRNLTERLGRYRRTIDSVLLQLLR